MVEKGVERVWCKIGKVVPGKFFERGNQVPTFTGDLCGIGIGLELVLAAEHVGKDREHLA